VNRIYSVVVNEDIYNFYNGDSCTVFLEHLDQAGIEYSCFVSRVIYESSIDAINNLRYHNMPETSWQ